MHATPKNQRGIGTIAVALILLFALTLAVFYTNRHVIFEQRTAVNTMRVTEAQEVAEAGMEWALGMMNATYEITDACTQTTTTASFRNRYLRPTVDATKGSVFRPVFGVNMGCRRSGSSWTCSCPASGNANLGSTQEASFTVNLTCADGSTNVDSNGICNVHPDAMLLTAHGCTAQTAACRDGSTAGADASVRVSAVIKASPLLPRLPASPLTCGTSCDVGGAYTVVNTDVATNGITVNAGTTITMSNFATNATQTIPGQPPGNSYVPADSSLASLASADSDCSDSAMFNTFFGTTIEEYKARPSTTTLSCSSTNDCKTKLDAAYNAGKRAFYFDSDVQLSGNGTLGSEADPVVLVTPNGLKINGTWDIFGVIFSNSADVNDNGTGSATLQGAMISCAAYSNNGSGKAAYNPNVMKAFGKTLGTMVRVPGSWRDWN